MISKKFVLMSALMLLAPVATFAQVVGGGVGQGVPLPTAEDCIKSLEECIKKSTAPKNGRDGLGQGIPTATTADCLCRYSKCLESTKKNSTQLKEIAEAIIETQKAFDK